MAFFKPELISADETMDLRQRILRPDQDITVCKYVEDFLSSTFHVGILDVNEKIISSGTFIAEKNNLFPDVLKPYRLRGMATDIHFQRQGCGRLIITYALHELENMQCDLLWFNARVSAELFYQKLGFKSDTTIFDIPTIGPHKIMYKRL